MWVAVKGATNWMNELISGGQFSVMPGTRYCSLLYNELPA